MKIMVIVLAVIIGLVLLALQKILSKKNNKFLGLFIPIIVAGIGIWYCVYKVNSFTFSDMFPFLLIEFILIEEYIENRIKDKSKGN